VTVTDPFDQELRQSRQSDATDPQAGAHARTEVTPRSGGGRSAGGRSGGGRSGEARSTEEQSGSAPEFAVAVRGYDRAQVDDYVAHVQQWFVEAEARTARADEAAVIAQREVAALQQRVRHLEERSDSPVPRSMTAFGERVGAVLQAALEAAEQLRTDAEEEAKAARNAFATDRESVLAHARAEADQLIEQAQLKEQAIGRQIDDLVARRQAAMTDLARVHGHLADLLGTPPPAGPFAQPAPNSSSSTASATSDGDKAEKPTADTQ